MTFFVRMKLIARKNSMEKISSAQTQSQTDDEWAGSRMPRTTFVALAHHSVWRTSYADRIWNGMKSLSHSRIYLRSDFTFENEQPSSGCSSSSHQRKQMNKFETNRTRTEKKKMKSLHLLIAGTTPTATNLNRCHLIISYYNITCSAHTTAAVICWRWWRRCDAAACKYFKCDIAQSKDDASVVRDDVCDGSETLCAVSQWNASFAGNEMVI